MENLKKSAVMLAAAALISVAGSANVFAAETVVEVNSIASETPEIVTFPAASAPKEIDNVLYVPSRIMADAMGMRTEWKQESQTAELVIDAERTSSKPIERYAYTISESGADSVGLNAVPEDMSIELKMDSSYAKVKFGYTDSSGERTELGKTVQLDGTVRLVDDGTLMFPLRSVVNTLCLDLSWEQESRTASVAIPEVAVIPDGLGVAAEDTNLGQTEAVVSAQSDTAGSNEQDMIYLGTFRISHYAPGAESNGIWGNATAWAGSISPGTTIAVDPSVIEPLSWVYIEGYGYRRAEDCGGAIKGNKIDVAVATYAEAMRLGVVYQDVYLCVD